MKKLLIYVMGLLCALSFEACTADDNNQKKPVEPAEIEEVADSLQEVTGIAVDGAMNSVYLKVGEDTIEFVYPDLDSEHRASWSINDTLTVRYYETENGDSVTDVILGSIS
jgi:hypothetical protein